MKYGVIVSDLSFDEADDILKLLRTREYEADQFGDDFKENTTTDNSDTVSQSGELDSSGMPWDARIHAQNKAKKADGTWKAGRGIDPELVKQVEAELKGASNVQAIDTPTPAASIPVPSMPSLPPVGQTTTLPQATPVAMVPSAPPAPEMSASIPFAPAAPAAPQAVPPLPAAPVQRDFNGLMAQISHLFAVRKVTDANYSNTIVDRINSGYAQHHAAGVKNPVTTLTDIISDEEYIKYAWEILAYDGNA